jgi:hypothetical protein
VLGPAQQVKHPEGGPIFIVTANSGNTSPRPCWRKVVRDDFYLNP